MACHLTFKSWWQLLQCGLGINIAASAGTTVFETSMQLGLSPNTVKTHLRKAFGKTGVSRQAELARLIASIGLLRFNSNTDEDLR